MRRNVDRLRVLIEDLLTLSRIESGAFRSTFEDVDLPPLVRSGVADLRPQAEHGGVEVRLDLPEGPVVVHGDPGQLARALLNVLGNAVKFTPSGGRVQVTVREDAENGSVAVEVGDSGMGIPEADLPEVFTRFFRGSNAVSASVPGTGLGLVIVRTILDNHGGSLGLSSVQGEGTTVRITLPYTPPAQSTQPSGIAAGRRSL